MKELADQEFRKADGDGNSVITREEFRRWLVRTHLISLKSKPEPAHIAYKKTVGKIPTAPTKRQLYYHCLRSGMPFIGFGFLDNVIMIVAGETLESTLGPTLGISTMAAAGLGNMISDAAGLGFGGTIEVLADKMGLPQTGLTAEQLELRISKMVYHISCLVGIMTGCLLGMFPLLFYDHEQHVVCENIDNKVTSSSEDQ
eukprot:CAMPEP_0174267462 /NCGR_PEP_ID=MMETSP0439-20130205/33681_1 /TAXON_ID=0 /ORGANISM="Stereomyxa ramosa, Strain Chinc5" /LENGTH=199 /DNA_ID=CAMNT_0015354969 /DNA_START=396 /DNA_END=995 /DNA_ORIENTATION=-